MPFKFIVHEAQKKAQSGVRQVAWHSIKEQKISDEKTRRKSWKHMCKSLSSSKKKDQRRMSVDMFLDCCLWWYSRRHLSPSPQYAANSIFVLIIIKFFFSLHASNQFSLEERENYERWDILSEFYNLLNRNKRDKSLRKLLMTFLWGFEPPVHLNNFRIKKY